MPQTVMVLFDNTLFMQNQDYLPSRFILQKEVTMSIINSLLQNNENSVGVAPLAQLEQNYMLTPTSNKPYLDMFISKLRLHNNLEISKVFLRSKIALLNRSESNKKMLVFFGADIEGLEFDRALLSLIRGVKGAVASFIKVSLILFGEKAEILKELISIEMEPGSCDIEVVDRCESFFNCSMRVFGMESAEIENDPDLAMALKLSLAEAKQGSAAGG